MSSLLFPSSFVIYQKGILGGALKARNRIVFTRPTYLLTLQRQSYRHQRLLFWKSFWHKHPRRLLGVKSLTPIPKENNSSQFVWDIPGFSAGSPASWEPLHFWAPWDSQSLYPQFSPLGQTAQWSWVSSGIQRVPHPFSLMWARCLTSLSLGFSIC